eukprot:5117440-Pyramimonas_sp.AAC.1
MSRSRGTPRLGLRTKNVHNTIAARSRIRRRQHCRLRRCYPDVARQRVPQRQLQHAVDHVRHE